MFRLVLAAALLLAPTFAHAERVCVEEANGVCLKYRNVPNTTPAAQTERRLNLSAPDRKDVQQGLNILGFDAGPPDGAFGRKTRSAIRDWQKATGAPQTGYLTDDAADFLVGVAVDARSPKDPRDGDWVGRLKCNPMESDWGNPPHSRPEGMAMIFGVKGGEGVWIRGPKEPGDPNFGGPFHERWELTLYQDGRALIQGIYEASPTPARAKLFQKPVLLDGTWDGDRLEMSGNRGPRSCRLEMSKYATR